MSLHLAPRGEPVLSRGRRGMGSGGADRGVSLPQVGVARSGTTVLLGGRGRD